MCGLVEMNLAEGSSFVGEEFDLLGRSIEPGAYFGRRMRWYGVAALPKFGFLDRLLQAPSDLCHVK